ncbi:MAG: (Fe-S)-binding protein [Bacillota bacterium]
MADNSATIKITDFSFNKEVVNMLGYDRFMSCYFCGTCTAGCAFSGLRSDIDPRKFIRQVILGLREDVLNSSFIWLCTICERCTINCPNEINIAELVQAIRGKFGIKPPGDLMLQCRAYGGSKSQLIQIARWLKEGLVVVDPSRNPLPVTYHDPCNLGRKEGIVEEPRFILNKICADFREMKPGKHYNYCCGSSGEALFTEEHENLRLAMGKLKAEQILRTGAQIVATSCLNCHDQLSRIAQKYLLDIEIVFVHELLDRALVKA